MILQPACHRTLLVLVTLTASVFFTPLTERSDDWPDVFGDYERGVPLWSGVPPGDNAVVSSTSIGEPYQARVVTPVLVAYPCGDSSPTGCTSILILPGGGFMGITVPAMAPGETEEAARRLQSLGFTALLLYYRSPAPAYGVQPPPSWAPLLDARRAMSLARANAARWHVDVHRLGVLGFSSGGALAALLSFGRWPESDRTVADEARSSLPAAIGEVTALDDALDAATRENRPINRPINRPAFTLLLYPSGFNSSEFARSWHMPTFDSHGELGALQPAVRPPPWKARWRCGHRCGGAVRRRWELLDLRVARTTMLYTCSRVAVTDLGCASHRTTARKPHSRRRVRRPQAAMASTPAAGSRSRGRGCKRSVCFSWRRNHSRLRRGVGCPQARVGRCKPLECSCR